MFAWLRSLLTRQESFGTRGERAAERYLVGHGYRVLRRQHRNHGGELDLIALDGDTVVFVEVKTRSGVTHGQPIDAVNLDKQRRMTRAALVYLKREGWLDRRSRYDVIAVVWPDRESTPQITHYRNAFEPSGSGQMFA
ncbi:MAG TPA: YraN family protein [Planctomycetaceae bacterium]|nr:YraN family protein [Planctomycetaceae bacterium]